MRREEKGPISIARKLRREETVAETKLWSRLRNRQLHGLKFRRQVPVEGFYADFLCHDAKLILELDGGQHAERVKRDQERTEILEAAGYFVLRFWNNDVITNIDGVLTQIVEHLKLTGGCLEETPAPHPTLSQWERASSADITPPRTLPEASGDYSPRAVRTG